MTTHWQRPAPLLILALLALLAGCAPSDEESNFLARRALLKRQNQGIRELIAEQEKGSLVPTDRFLVGLDEKPITDLLRASLPLERPVGKHFIVRLEKADVSLRDKYGVITLEGELHRPATPDRKTAVRIHGGLGGVSIDPATGQMSIRIAIEHVELMEAGILENVLGRGGKKLLATKGKELLRDAIPELHIPVALAQSIPIPAFEGGGIEMDSLTIPLNVSVERVIAAGGKLWVTVNAKVGPVTGGEGGLGLAVGKKAPKGGGQ